MILRIPSFKPNAEPSEKPPVNGDTPEAGASIRDAIAKSITHKFQSETPSSAGFPRHPSIHQQQQQLQQHQQQQQQQRQSAQGKGTRPKRGKYRNYDRDSLVEAVRAVQRGEMSVHRAGSYYGVPHSTLEYKVKERHLMRPRKREPKTEDKTKMLPSPMPLDKSGKQPPLAPKPLVNPPFPPPNGLKLPPSLFETGVSPLATYAGAPFPFWPPHPFGHGLPLPPTPEQMFAPSLPAATRRIAESLYDGSGHNGSFLDGIIRSSLELGLKKAAEKSGKETQHMSNKALIDQLCLNSRIPPVPPVPPVPPAPRSTEAHSDEERHVPYDLSRSSDDDSDDRDDRTKRTDDNEIQTADEDEDMDNISNHASEDDEPADS